MVDHHPDFLAGAAQPYRVRQRQSWLISRRIRVGCGEAIVEQCCEPVWTEMDDHLVGMYLDPLDQSDEE